MRYDTSGTNLGSRCDYCQMIDYQGVEFTALLKVGDLTL